MNKQTILPQIILIIWLSNKIIFRFILYFTFVSTNTFRMISDSIVLICLLCHPPELFVDELTQMKNYSQWSILIWTYSSYIISSNENNKLVKTVYYLKLLFSIVVSNKICPSPILNFGLRQTFPCTKSSKIKITNW